jgi:hypothetical protein
MRQRILWYELDCTLLDSEQMNSDPGQNEPRVCCNVNAPNFHAIEVLTGAVER